MNSKIGNYSNLVSQNCTSTQVQIDMWINDQNCFYLNGGNGFLQIGKFRIGNVDGTHFSISHESGYTSVIYRSDGTIHPGPRKDFGLWHLEQGEIQNVYFGDNYIEFGQLWRLGQTDHNHFSLSHRSGYTCMIWRVDGTKHPGPRTDFNKWVSSSHITKGIGFGQDFFQIGHWRVGSCDDNHMSIATTLTADIYRGDGTIHPGPRLDFIQSDKQLQCLYQ